MSRKITSGFILVLDNLMRGQQPQRGHLEQQRMKQQLLRTGPLLRVGLQAQVDEVLLISIERLYRLLYELGRDRMGVAVAAELQVEHFERHHAERVHVYRSSLFAAVTFSIIIIIITNLSFKAGCSCCLQ